MWTWIASYASLTWICFTPVHAQTMDEIKQTVRKRFPEVPQLSTAELAQWIADTSRPTPLLVDVRAPKEFAISHLQGATNSTRVEDVVRARGSKDRPVVVYCSIGYRSAAFADKLMQKGVTNIYNLEGSIFQWANEDRPVYRGSVIVQEVHPYSPKWGKLLKRSFRRSS